METIEYQFQINSAVGACQGRIENGADVAESFKWLNEELANIYIGITVYTYEEF